MAGSASVLILITALAFGARDARAMSPILSVRSDLAPRDLQTRLAVSIPGVDPGAAMPANNTRNGRNISPPVAWSEGPAGVASYALAMEDPDGHGADPVVHWLIYNIPTGVRGLSKGLRNVGALASPLGAIQGVNDHGSLGYSGPNPPVGDPAHAYHIQVFALDRRLRLAPGASREALAHAMRGHILASGELIITYAAPRPPPADPRSPPG